MEHNRENQTDARRREWFYLSSVGRTLIVFGLNIALFRSIGNPLSIYLDMLSRPKKVASVWDVIFLATPFMIWSVLFFASSFLAARPIWHQKNIISWSFIGVMISAYTFGASTFLFGMMRFVIVYKSFEANLALCVLVICVGLPILSAFLWVRRLKLKLS